MKTKLFIATIGVVLALSACTTQKPIEVAVTINPLEQIIIDHPAPPRGVTTRSTEWVVITSDNVDQLFMGDVVIFGVTPDDYEDLALNLAELKRYILSQQEIIVFYQNTITRFEDEFKSKEPIIEE